MTVEWPLAPPAGEMSDVTVLKAFSAVGRKLNRGAQVSRAEILSWRNWRALVAARYVELMPASAPTIGLIAVSRGFGRFDVIEGRKVNDRPLTREQAEALAADESPDEGKDAVLCPAS